MTATGTIDRPHTRYPQKQVPTMKPSTREPSAGDTPARSTSGVNTGRQNRNREMQLIPEAMARVHMQDRLQEAESERRAVSLITARRMQRRAERASLRARRALAMALMQ